MLFPDILFFFWLLAGYLILLLGVFRCICMEAMWHLGRMSMERSCFSSVVRCYSLQLFSWLIWNIMFEHIVRILCIDGSFTTDLILFIFSWYCKNKLLAMSYTLLMHRCQNDGIVCEYKICGENGSTVCVCVKAT